MDSTKLADWVNWNNVRGFAVGVVVAAGATAGIYETFRIPVLNDRIAALKEEINAKDKKITELENQLAEPTASGVPQVGAISEPEANSTVELNAKGCFTAKGFLAGLNPSDSAWLLVRYSNESGRYYPHLAPISEGSWRAELCFGNPDFDTREFDAVLVNVSDSTELGTYSRIAATTEKYAGLEAGLVENSDGFVVLAEARGVKAIPPR